MARGNAHSQTGPKGITDDMIAEVMRKTLGNPYFTAQALKCSSQNIRYRIKASKALLELQQELRFDLKDIAVGVVVEALRKKDTKAAMFVLDRVGKDDGWSRQIEHTGKGGAAIQHAVTAETFSPSTPEEIAAARRRFIDDGDDEGAEGA
jgi:hypothetical protein